MDTQEKIRRLTGKGMQHPVEVEFLVKLIEEYNPRTILEIGCAGGGTTGIFLSNGAKVVTVDIFLNPMNQYYFLTEKDMFPNPDIQFIEGRSQDESTFKRVIEASPSYDWVFIDGEHELAPGWRDWELYSPLATMGVGIHDICNYTWLQGDWFPRVFWKEHRHEYKTIEFADVPSGGWGIVLK